ncbi:MAG: right-handed parallel beta-helix repeat-containing protein, partial [Planctomycetota bacterium]
MICAPRRWTASVSCTLLLLSGLASAQTIYVDASNPNCPGTGTQTDPYCLIQTAIGAANTGDTVLVAPGTYLENVDFLGKAIEVRSSNGPGVTTIDGNLLGSAVAFRTGEGPLSKLSGFRIQNGSGTPCGVGTTCGGGIVCDGSSPSIEGNELVQNNATFGGGILCLNLAAPAIVNNTISSNTAQNSNGGVGCLYGAAPVIRGNTISSNSATYASGGVGAYLSSPHIVGNDITGNSVTRYMGGVGAIAGNPIIERNHIEGNTSSYVMGGIGCANGAAPIITGNTITANRAIRLSGGVGLAYGASATLANNTITNNVAGSAAGVGCFYASTATIVNDTLSGNQAYFAPGGGIVVDAGSTVNVTNAILWYNVPLETFNLGGTININTSDVRGGYPGTGNIAADPLFVSSATGDFRLTCASPCVDAGNGSPGIPLPLFDQSGLDLRQIGPIDMGSDEAGALWQVNGPVRPGGPAVTATVTAVPSHPRGTAEIQFSLMPQTGADG